MPRPRCLRSTLLRLAILAACAAAPVASRAAEHIILTNGFSVDCVRHDTLSETGKIRLYPIGSAIASSSQAASYIELPAASIQSIELLADTPAPVLPLAPPASPAAADLHALLTQAGARHNIDVDLLASVVNAESGGHPSAVSRAGARGLMQLMPATAASLGVQDSFRPDQNIAGGTTYLDQLLTRYHDDVVLALAAYNAGPGAVDRFHGVPPYRETRAYVTRIVNEFNRRKRLALQTASIQAIATQR